MPKFKKNNPAKDTALYHSNRLAELCYPKAGKQGSQKNFLSRINYAVKIKVLPRSLPERIVNAWAREIFPKELAGHNLPADFHTSVSEGVAIDDFAIDIPTSSEELTQQYIELARTHASIIKKHEQLVKENSALRGKKRDAASKPRWR
jgi:hypothetical protein